MTPIGDLIHRKTAKKYHCQRPPSEPSQCISNYGRNNYKYNQIAYKPQWEIVGIWDCCKLKKARNDMAQPRGNRLMCRPVGRIGFSKPTAQRRGLVERKTQPNQVPKKVWHHKRTPPASPFAAIESAVEVRSSPKEQETGNYEECRHAN